MELVAPPRPLYWADIIYVVQEILADLPEIYLVGGTVRDVYRDHPFKDIDLTCPKDGQVVARRLANALHGAYYPLDAERGVGRALVTFQGDDYVIDVAALRGDSLLADLQDRDFTINAMAVPLASDLGAIYDPLGGLQDWQAKLLRCCSPSSIKNDPIRALRAVRLSLSLGLSMEPHTRDQVRHDGTAIVNSSPERVRDEFMNLLGGKKPQGGLVVLDALGLLRLIVPEINNRTPAEWRAIQTQVEKMNTLLKVIGSERDDNIAANAEFGTFVYLLDRYRSQLATHLGVTLPNQRTRRMLLILATLLSFETVETAQARAMGLKLSSEEVDVIANAALFQDYPQRLHAQADLTEREIYRYWRHTGDFGIDAVLMAVVNYLAEHGMTLNTPAWTAFLQTMGMILAGYTMAMQVMPLVDGNDLMKVFDLPPGRHIGDLLEALREAQALGEILTRDDALLLAENLLAGGDLQNR